MFNLTIKLPTLFTLRVNSKSAQSTKNQGLYPPQLLKTSTFVKIPEVMTEANNGIIAFKPIFSQRKQSRLTLLVLVARLALSSLVLPMHSVLCVSNEDQIERHHQKNKAKIHQDFCANATALL